MLPRVQSSALFCQCTIAGARGLVQVRPRYVGQSKACSAEFLTVVQWLLAS